MDFSSLFSKYWMFSPFLVAAIWWAISNSRSPIMDDGELDEFKEELKEKYEEPETEPEEENDEDYCYECKKQLSGDEIDIVYNECQECEQSFCDVHLINFSNCGEFFCKKCIDRVYPRTEKIVEKVKFLDNQEQKKQEKETDFLNADF